VRMSRRDFEEVLDRARIHVDAERSCSSSQASR
jgi:hypothetical protein